MLRAVAQSDDRLGAIAALDAQVDSVLHLAASAGLLDSELAPLHAAASATAAQPWDSYLDERRASG
jgi:hypothetical protein